MVPLSSICVCFVKGPQGMRTPKTFWAPNRLTSTITALFITPESSQFHLRAVFPSCHLQVTFVFVTKLQKDTNTLLVPRSRRKLTSVEIQTSILTFSASECFTKHVRMIDSNPSINSTSALISTIKVAGNTLYTQEAAFSTPNEKAVGEREVTVSKVTRPDVRMMTNIILLPRLPSSFQWLMENQMV